MGKKKKKGETERKGVRKTEEKYIKSGKRALKLHLFGGENLYKQNGPYLVTVVASVFLLVAVAGNVSGAVALVATVLFLPTFPSKVTKPDHLK